MTRAKVLDSIKTNSMIYYTYLVKDGETPEIIAAKYYDNPNRHWIILLANDIIDPQYDWVMSYDVFNNYIIKKYDSIASAKTTISHYTKTITKTDSVTGVQTQTVYVIDQGTYNNLPDSEYQTIGLSSGGAVSIVTTRQVIFAYDDEEAKNEAKRTIKIIDKRYAQQIEKELTDLYS